MHSSTHVFRPRYTEYTGVPENWPVCVYISQKGVKGEELFLVSCGQPVVIPGRERERGIGKREFSENLRRSL